LFTTLAYAISAFALNPNFYNGVVNESDLSIILACLPIFVGIFGLSAFHEGVHLLVAKRRGVKLGLPVPLPSLQIGTFGNITPLRSFPQSRSALFDIALSGPIITSLVSTLMIIGGILLTINTPVDSISTLPVVPAVLVKMSFLVGSITSVLAPKVMMLPLSQPIPIHPLFMIGFTGLVGSALNMLPIGKLDGGRACNAVLGRRPAYLISLISLLFMAISALTGFSTISIFWGLIITLFQRNADVPVRDDLTNVNDFRMGVYIFSIILTVLTLAPFPGVPGAL
jgi:membrane-associated protease RseP (regulator of RpoE activity)